MYNVWDLDWADPAELSDYQLRLAWRLYRQTKGRMARYPSLADRARMEAAGYRDVAQAAAAMRRALRRQERKHA